MGPLQQRRERRGARSLSELVREGELLVVVGDVGAESLISSGIILRALRTLGVDFEFYLSIDPVDFGQLKGRVVGVDAHLENCATCLELAEPRPRKPSQHVFRAVLDLLREDVSPSKEEYVLLLSSALAKYTPRSLRGALSEEVKELARDMVSSGIVREVVAPRLIGWGSMPLEEVVRYSVDACLLRYFGRPTARVAESEVARELGVESLKELEDRTYVPNYDAGVLDLYEAAYVIEHAVDVEGPEYAASMPLNYGYFLWAVRRFRESVVHLRECVDAFLEKRSVREGPFYVLECDPKASGTVLTKVLRGLRLIEENSVVVYRVAGKYYAPLQSLSRAQRVGLSGSKTEGGYAVLDSSTLGKLRTS